MSFSAPSAAIRVLVVDDSVPFREATRAVIRSTPGFEWVGDADSGEGGVEQAARLEPDLVLMDVRMPGIGGVEAARRIAARCAASIVILITAAEVDVDLPDPAAGELVPKQELSPTALRRLWRDRGLRRA